MKAIYFLCLTVCLFVSSLKAQTVDFTFSTATGNFCAPQLVSFSAQAGGNPESFLWVFGDGQVGYEANKSILYTHSGTYTVSLTVIYDSYALTTSKTITIHPSPTLTVSSNIQSMCAPGTVNFTANGTGNISSYHWEFGDGSSTTTQTPNSSHTYNDFGNFTTTVTASSPEGCTATATVVTNITRNPISGYVTPVRGCIPTQTTLVSIPYIAPGDAIQSVYWDYGDGSTATTTTPYSIHSYNSTQPITTASVTVTTVQGCISTFNFPSFAYGSPPTQMQVQTATGATTFCASEPVEFMGTATSASQYVWNFGDGSAPITTSLTEVTHNYTDLGTFTVTVTPSMNGCAGTPDTMQIEIVGVIANYSVRNSCSDKKTYVFQNSSGGNIDHFEWTFSDSSGMVDSVNFSPVHTFPNVGSFVAKLLLVDSITGCKDSLSFNIFTAEPVFSSSLPAVCKDSLLVYSVHQTYAAQSGRVYQFHVADSILHNGTDSILHFYPDSFGTFNDYVVISDPTGASCSDTLYLSNATDVWGPMAMIQSNPETCIDTAMSFTNSSYPFNAAYPIRTWHWEFGDGSSSDLHTPPPHLYNVDDSFQVVMVATDINNCAQSDTLEVIVRPLPIVVIFPISDTLCLNDSVELKVYSADSIFWMPHPDIQCTTNCDTVVVYPSAPTQYIAGTVSAFGCRGYDSTAVWVYLPFDLEILPSDTAVCPGSPVLLQLNHSGEVTWSPPQFLNSTSSQSPISTPDTSIRYQVVLLDDQGCFSDTAEVQIDVHPSPTVDAGPDIVLPYNSPFTLSPAYGGNINTYLWTPPDNLSCTHCATPSGTALSRTMYQVLVSNTYGCVASDSLWVDILCEGGNIFVPNAFTPDGDGLNDYFYPITRGYQSIRSFSVYNRLGERVFFRQNFDPNSHTLGWDGSVKGNKFRTTEAFVWMVEAVCFSGEIIQAKGMVTLVR